MGPISDTVRIKVTQCIKICNINPIILTILKSKVHHLLYQWLRWREDLVLQGQLSQIKPFIDEYMWAVWDGYI